MRIFLALISGDYFSSFEDPEIYGWKTRTIYCVLWFLNWFYVVLIGLLVCVVQGKAKQTAAAIERGFRKYGRSIASDVESPSPLPSLLLLPPPPPLCCCCCCCCCCCSSYCPCCCFCCLLLPLLAAAAAAAAAASSAAPAIASIWWRSHLRRAEGRRWSSTWVWWFGVGDGCYTADGVRIVVVSYMVRVVHKIQVTRSSRDRSELAPVLRGFAYLCPFQELREKIRMIFCPIIDGSDFWASEIAEKSRNKGSKNSHRSWSTAVFLSSFLCFLRHVSSRLRRWRH